MLSFLLSFLYFDKSFKKYEIYTKPVEIVGVVEEIKRSGSYSNRLLIDVESINGEKQYNCHVYAYTTKKESSGVVMDGTRISFTATLGGFSKESMSYNISNGINAYANDIDDIKVIEHNVGGIKSSIKRIREYVSRYTILISDSDTGALLSALLLGERDYLPDKLRLDFKRIGISHILALSGMHLAILSFGIGKFLSFCKVKKKPRTLIISVFILLYMAFTGFSVSVCRAGIMLIVSSLLFLLGRTKDSLTSLSVAVVIICIVTPYAIFDISLWLSALATFGIIAFGEVNLNKEKPISIGKKIIHYIYLSCMTSVFAISATLLVSTFSFGGLSILAPIATLIFSILAEVIMYLGCVMVLIGWIIPVGALISPLTKLLYYIAGLMSSFEYSYVSTNFEFVKIAVIVYTLLFFSFIILNLKNTKLCLKILLVCFAAVTILPTFATIRQDCKETVAYYGSYKSDIMLVRSKSEVCIIDSSQYSTNTAYNVLDILEGAKVSTLDKYYLTHYSWSIDDELSVLLYNIAVDKIYIPSPRNDEEETILKIIRQKSRKSSTEIVVYEQDEAVDVGKYTIKLLYSAPNNETSVNSFAVSKGDTTYTYISSGILQGDRIEQFEKYMALSDYIILGDHGQKYKKEIYLNERWDDLDAIVLHSENVFLNQDKLTYYTEKGCKIYSHPEEIIYFN